MDKFEYKVRADEIKELIARGEYPQAAEIADTIDWRRVKSVMMLCTISDLYKINRRYEDAKNMLLLAYERRPGGKTICYSLCELCIKTEEFIQAVNYYKEFVQVAPKDPGRYILQYKLYEAQDVGLEERIGVLEELKKRDYREKWAYELAYLYHRVGLATRCVEECDELILWFGEGKYVIKAMELKMLHQPLTAAQQEKYNHRFDGWGVPGDAEMTSEAETPVRSQENWEEPEENRLNQEEAAYAPVEEQPVVPREDAPAQPEEMDIQVKTMDVGQYNTINLQAELAEGLKEVLSADKKSDAITRSILAPLMDSDTETLDFPEIDEVDESDLGPEAEVMEESEVFFGETADMGNLSQESMEALGEGEEILPGEEAAAPEPETEEQPGETTESAAAAEKEPEEKKTGDTAEIVMNQLRQESAERPEDQVLTAQPPRELAGVLSQESDGQISLVVPEKEAVEKQITGQMSIEDILSEWERMKKENEEKRKEEVRQHVLQQTGTMFTEFEASVRDGLLEQLERGKAGPQASEEKPEAEPEETEASGPEYVGPDVSESEFENAGIEESGDILEEGYDAGTQEYEEEAAAAAEPEEVSGADDYGETEEIEELEETAGPEEVYEETGYGETEEIEELEEAAGPEEVYEETDYGETEEIEEVQETAGPEEVYEETGYGETEESEEEKQEAEPEETYGEDDYGEAGGIEKIRKAEKSKPEEPARPPVEREKARVRALTREEKELYAPFIQSRSGREELVKAIDNISMAAYTGNIIITGEEGMDTLSLAKNMIREVQMTDSNFAGKVAKISGQGMNAKNVAETLERLKGGALIIQKAAGMEANTVKALHKALQKESFGIIIVLEDTKKAMGRLLASYPPLGESFTARMNVEAMSNDTLVAFGRQYAREREYSIDELGVLALHTRIEELQTIDHVVTVMEVKEIMDEAIHHANRKTLGHFFDILFARRYDDEDMIVLTEKDFV